MYEARQVPPSHLVSDGRVFQIYDAKNSYRGLFGTSWAFQSCGVGTLQGFNSIHVDLNSFEAKANFLSTVVKQLYTCGNTLYVITKTQLNCPVHCLFLELGAKELTHFKNLYHGPEIIYVFHVNVRHAIGRYVDNNGNPLKEPPTDDSNYWVEPKTVPHNPFTTLPYIPPERPQNAKPSAKPEPAQPIAVDPNLPEPVQESRKEAE